MGVQSSMVHNALMLNPNLLLRYSDPAYTHPTHADLRSLLESQGWGRKDVCNLVGVAYNAKNYQSPTVDKWLSGDPDAPSRISYAHWRLLLIEAGLV
ncbi:hypothetical protein MED297_00015 [Reinekea sp. MED297]|uniref:Uncharacterized protein n=2 Tax=Reinekea TaxID=230494 RepID=A4BJV7_9GAMM|nr:hypothetical protein MED297_00015 [Reinekea sp. MED297] [Reinekea blandensis MED297]